MRFLISILLSALLASAAFAQTTSGYRITQPISQMQPTLPVSWTIEEITDGSVEAEIVPDNRDEPRDGLPDGKIAVPETEQDIAEAWYREPTTRYKHAVLGDDIEAGSLVVETPRGVRFTYRLPKTEVFEDITPRLADLDQDGTTEVITILSAQGEGASVAVFGLVGNALIKKAQTAFIGRSNRWLNIAGIADFTGSRDLEIAIVETPHLAGLLKFYQLRGGQFRNSVAIPGLSNHQIGSRELRLSAVAKVDNNQQQDLILPSLDRRTLYMIGLSGGGLNLLSSVALPAAVDKAIGTEGSGDSLAITIGLDDGKIYRITR